MQMTLFGDKRDLFLKLQSAARRMWRDTGNNVCRDTIIKLMTFNILLFLVTNRLEFLENIFYLHIDRVFNLLKAYISRISKNINRYPYLNNYGLKRYKPNKECLLLKTCCMKILKIKHVRWCTGVHFIWQLTTENVPYSCEWWNRVVWQ